MNTADTTIMRIAKLYRYPVKSMGGEPLQRAPLFSNGFIGDRRYAIIDVESSEIACAKIPRLWGALLNFSAKYVHEPMKGRPLPPIAITFPDGQVKRSDSADIDADLSNALGKAVQLVSHTPGTATSRALWKVVQGHEATEWSRQHTVGTEGGKDVLRWELSEAVPKISGEDTFFDMSAIHLLTTATLRQFESLSPGVSFDHRRFRPNIFLETPTSGFVEQDWLGKTVRLGSGDASISIIVPTPRCAMPTLEQVHERLERDIRVLRAIALHNNLEVQALGSGRWACAGVLASVLTEGVVEVGADCEIDPHTA